MASLAACVACSGDGLRSAYGWLESGVARVDYGAAALGVERTRTVEVIQRGLVEAMVEGLEIEPDDGTFAVVDPPARVGRDARALLHVAYRPRQPGPHRARLLLRLDSGPALELRLSGKGVDARATGDAALRFGRPLLGTTRVRPLRLANDAEAPVPVSLAIVGPDAAQFAVTPELTLEPSGRVEVFVTFSAVGLPGPREAALRIVRCPTCAPESHPIQAEAIERTLELAPSPVAFGAVPVDTERRRELVVSNVSDLFVVVSSVSLAEGGDEGFGVEADGLPRVLAPLDALRVPLRFSPTRLGLARGAVTVASDAPDLPLASVPLLATAGGAQLVVTPERLTFRATPAMGRAVLPVRIANGGADPASPPLTVEGLSVEGDGFSLVQGVAPGTTLAAGRSVEVRVAFSTSVAGPFEGRLSVRADDPMTPLVDVRLDGHATGAADDCVLTVQPPLLDFGDVRPGKGALLGVRITHAGPQPCALWDGRVEGDPAFALQRARPFVRLAPGGSVFMPVAFRPPAPGRYAAALAVQTGSASLPLLRVPVRGASSVACLRGDPAYVEFGRRRVDCGPVTKEAIVRNACPTIVDVATLEVGPGADPGAFALLAATPVPVALAPGQPLRATIRFTPGVTGFTAAPLFAGAAGAADPVLTTLTGESLPAARHEEAWVQPAPAKVDLLLVVDNTASLQDERAALARSVAAFLRDADLRGLDYHVAVTTTGIDAPPAATLAPCPGGVLGAEAGRLFPVDRSRPRVVDASMPDRASVLAANVEVGGCHTVEQGFEAMRRALAPPLVDGADDPRTPEPLDGNRGFLRPDAALAVVVVSDEDDASPLEPAAAAALVRALKPASPVVFGAVVAPSGGCSSAVAPGMKYLDVARALDGLVASVCDTDWSPALTRLVDRLAEPPVRYPLVAPADPATLVVTLDGAPAADVRYEPVPPSIVFAAPPAPGRVVRASYSEPCPP